jgi:hypothetical protein
MVQIQGRLVLCRIVPKLSTRAIIVVIPQTEHFSYSTL